MYGATAGEGERTENALVDLRRAGHVYVSTKLAAEMLMHSYRQMYGQEFTILRYGIPYGPRMRDALVVAKFVRPALDGQPITIAGTGRPAAQLRLRRGPGRRARTGARPGRGGPDAGAGRGTGVSVREIADTVRSLVGDTARSSTCPPATRTTAASACPNTLAKELLDWSPVTSFAEGVQRYLDWLAAQP